MKVAALALVASALAAPALAQGQMDLPPERAELITNIIQAHDFNCPLVKLLWSRGEGPRGTVLKAFCGPADGEGVYQNAVFRLTLTPSDRVLVEPWTD